MTVKVATRWPSDHLDKPRPPHTISLRWQDGQKVLRGGHLDLTTQIPLIASRVKVRVDAPDMPDHQCTGHVDPTELANAQPDDLITLWLDNGNRTLAYASDLEVIE